ncbi:RHS repeat-associated core domain-containing protein [Pseudomonas citri]|uniref:RHS repeat-associated core domain-containing protein n=1 Tax=Pseudomonas citri TaxID=2978349 RepID=UPI0021B5167A|nr:RHS repeat-associated core domain-containing protein [Pseudomonas citri]
MSKNRTTLLCRYHYDPLDRLADCTPSAQANSQRFYLKNRLATEIQGSTQRSIFQQDDQLLAQQQRQDGVIETTLLATDQQRSVLHVLDATQPHPLVYTPYGHRPSENGLLSLLGFNGERPDPITGHYLLGNGYRAFNPVLMRFNSPDSLSPFGEGGLNAYAYCVGDPVNRTDPSGHLPSFLKFLRNFLRPQTPRTRVATTAGATNSNVQATAQSLTKRGKSPEKSIPQSSLERFSKDPIYAQVQDSQAPVKISQRTGPLPAPPPNARLHTEWSVPEPEFLKGSLYDVPENKTTSSRPRRLETIPEHPSPQTPQYIKKAMMINIIGIDHYNDAQKVIRNGEMVNQVRLLPFLAF